MNTLLTGSPVNGVRPAPNDWKNTTASIDQTLLFPAPVFKGRQALYLAADNRVDNATPQVANRAIAYSGPDQPIYPELKPSLVYARLFNLHYMWIINFPQAPGQLVADARRMVITVRELALGHLVVGVS